MLRITVGSCELPWQDIDLRRGIGSQDVRMTLAPDTVDIACIQLRISDSSEQNR